MSQKERGLYLGLALAGLLALGDLLIQPVSLPLPSLSMIDSPSANTPKTGETLQ